ncbi:hypothetical protein CCAN2_2030008 [Capnocytophaga canimorsus]|nr:hypothetical protein CCAN2_2030008 [Capnocytophaga canimorsus]
MEERSNVSAWWLLWLKEPRLLLLDEPFSQVDQFKKNHLQRNLFA